MDSIANTLLQTLGGAGMAQLGQHLGADPQATSGALSTAVPMLVSALAGQVQQPQGAQYLHQTLQQHDTSALDNVGNYLQNPQQANGGGLLEHLLGGQQQGVAQGIAQATGMSSDETARLLEIAAPLVIGYLARQQHQQNLNPGGLAQMLGQHQQQAQQANPQIAGLLNRFLGGTGQG